MAETKKSTKKTNKNAAPDEQAEDITAAATKSDNSEESTSETTKATIAGKTDATEVNSTTGKPKTTKAGKHSAKSQAEAEAAEAKEERKAAEQIAASNVVKRVHVQHVKRHTKGYKAALAQVDKDKTYALDEAVALLQKITSTKFDASVEVHARLGIDPRQADQIVRTSVVLPAGSGKTARIAVLAGDKEAKAAATAGADITDSEKLLESLGKGQFDFDTLIATPDQMPTLGRHAKVLGPKGLMPSPKSGTVTTDPAKAVKEIKAGKAEVKNDSLGIVHVTCGKISFKATDLVANCRAVIDAILRAKPSGSKGIYLRSLHIAASMSPSIKLDTNAVAKTK